MMRTPTSSSLSAVLFKDCMSEFTTGIVSAADDPSLLTATVASLKGIKILITFSANCHY